MAEMADCLMKEYEKNFIGHNEECLVEEVIYIDGRRYYSGHNERYIKLVFECDTREDVFVNEIVSVVPQKIYDDGTMLCSYKKPC